MSSNISRAPGFFPTIRLLFKGPEALAELYTTSPIRAILRLLLLILLCSVLYAVAVTITETHKTNPIMERFAQSAGDVCITMDRIFLSVKPEQSRILKLKRFNVGYYPNGTFNPENFAKGKEIFGIEIVDRYVAIWFVTSQNVDNDIFNVLLMTPSDLINLLTGRMAYPSNHFYTRQELTQILAAPATDILPTTTVMTEEQDQRGNQPILKYTSDDLFRIYIFMWGLLSFLQTLFYDILLLGLTVFLVSVVQMLYSGARPQSLAPRQAVTVTVYCTFVALIIATIVSIPESQFISFTSIFFIIFMIYQFIGFSKIQRLLNPLPDQDD